jgi:hypothetical protein
VATRQGNAGSLGSNEEQNLMYSGKQKTLILRFILYIYAFTAQPHHIDFESLFYMTCNGKLILLTVLTLVYLIRIRT